MKETITMADYRSKNPADQITFLIDAIGAKRDEIREALEAINQYADALKRVTQDAQQRLLTKD